MVRDMGLFGVYTRKKERIMIDDMEAVLRSLKFKYERRREKIYIPAEDKEPHYILSARPLAESYELATAFFFHEDSCPNTAAWFADLKTREQKKCNSEIKVSYSLNKTVFRYTASCRSGENKERIFLELIGCLDRAVKDNHADFESLSNGVVSDNVLNAAREKIYPVVMEVEQCRKTVVE